MHTHQRPLYSALEPLPIRIQDIVVNRGNPILVQETLYVFLEDLRRRRMSQSGVCGVVIIELWNFSWSINL